MRAVNTGCLALWLLAACSVETAGLGNSSDGAIDAPAAIDAWARDAADGALPGDAGPFDAGPPSVPTDPVTLASSSGAYDSHPAIAWSGTEFVIGYLVSATGGSQVEVARMPPGGAPLPGERVTTGSLPRRSVAIAPRGSEIAVGWIEDPAGTAMDFRLEVRTVPSRLDGRYGPIAPLSDHDDVQLAWDGADVLAVVRRPDPGGEALGLVRIGTTMSVDPPFATAPSFGDVRRAKTSSEPVVISGATREMWSLAGGAPRLLSTVTGIAMGTEGDAAELASGDFVGVWSETSATRTLFAAPMRRSGSTLVQDVSPVALGWDGPDPAIDAVGDRAVIAWCDETDGMRPIAVGMIAADGAIVVDRCALPTERPATNEPDIACGGGWCAIVWLEADARDGDHATRVMQIPAVEDRSRFCP
jgi:hypothetical protein